jgi:hypothetical protein
MAMFDTHPAVSSVQQISLPQSDPGAGYALAKAGQPGGPTHVAPFSASNYGAARHTAWDTSTFGANRGSNVVRGSFVNFSTGTTPYPQAGM